MLNLTDKFIIIKLINEIFIYLNLIISVMGIFGNILMFVVFSQISMKKLSVSLYLRAVAISSLFMNIYWLDSNTRQWQQFRLADQSQIWCRLIQTSSFVAMSTSSWVQVAASFDSFLTIVYPSRFKFIKSQTCRLIIILILTFYSIFANIFTFLDHQIKQFYNPRTKLTVNGCVAEHPREIVIISVVNAILVPFLFMLILSLATFRGVIQARKRARTTSSSTCTRLQTLLRTKLSQSTTRMRDIKFGITLLILNLIYLVTNAPFALIYLNITNNYLSKVLLQTIWFVVVNNFVIFMFILHYGINFYLQLGVNKLFRKVFLEIFKLRRR